MEKRWNLLTAEPGITGLLEASLKISPALCRILAIRGIQTYEQAREFFRPELSRLHSPWLMKDMGKAVNRIMEAKKNGEKILIFGDYDVDGTASVAMMYQFLQTITDPAAVDFYIPDRYKEGYGISARGIEFAHANGFTLVISLDCGIKSAALIADAKSKGIDFIVCDHHLPDNTLPDAVAILDPKQQDCSYPFKELCGCGVGFKLISALAERLAIPPQATYIYLDLVATAIAADIVPVTGENRILAYFGMKKMNDDPCNGFRALIHHSKLQKIGHITNVLFAIAPRINAAGRMDDGRKAVRLLIEKDYSRALAYAENLQAYNDTRREADSTITKEALEMIALIDPGSNRRSTVVFNPDWHKGVVGIVASRLIEKYYRPTIVLTGKGELVSGSARSVQGFNVYEAIHACREHLIGYGGHFAAAGMTLLPQQVEPFMRKFEEVVALSISRDQLVPELNIDAEVSFSDLKPNFYNIICQMNPFGPGNKPPVFICRQVMNTGRSKIVKENHIRFSLLQNNILFNGIGFNMKEKFPRLQLHKPLDVVFTLDENEWNNQKELQLKVLDFRLSVL